MNQLMITGEVISEPEKVSVDKEILNFMIKHPKSMEESVVLPCELSGESSILYKEFIKKGNEVILIGEVNTYKSHYGFMQTTWILDVKMVGIIHTADTVVKEQKPEMDDAAVESVMDEDTVLNDDCSSDLDEEDDLIEKLLHRPDVCLDAIKDMVITIEE